MNNEKGGMLPHSSFYVPGSVNKRPDPPTANRDVPIYITTPSEVQ